MLNDLQFYKKHGWVHLQKKISDDVVHELRTRSIKLRKWVSDKVGHPSKYGGDTHWNGLGCAGMYDTYLLDFYKSNLMVDIATQLLNSKDIWLYNDQVVVKLPNDNFAFEEHTDNTIGGNFNEGANTINMSVILNDFTDENGTLQLRDTKIYPKAGDIVVIHGDTPHQSEPNTSDKPRCLYACVYSDKQIIFKNFYKERIVKSII